MKYALVVLFVINITLAIVIILKLFTLYSSYILLNIDTNLCLFTDIVFFIYLLIPYLNS